MTPSIKHLRVIFFVLILFEMPYCFAQQVQKAESEPSFFEIQETFYDYWKPFNVKRGYYIEDGIEKKAYGWKQFKRWEWYWQQRIDPQTGAFPDKTAADIRREIRTTGSTKDDASNWTSVGPDFSLGGYAGVGRINCIGFRPGDNNTYYVGSPSGGFWKTTDDAATWTPLTDQNDVIGVSDVAVIAGATTDDDILYIATGDRDVGPMSNLPSNHLADNHSVGILKSTDGGATWSATGLSFSAGDRILTNRIILHPTNNDILYAATSDGLYKTSDAGTSWTNISSENFVDLEFKPDDPSTIYASTRIGGEVWVSNNNGISWSEQLNVVGGYRTELAVTPDEPNWIYAVVVDGSQSYSAGLNAVYRSINNGATFDVVYEHPNAGNSNDNILHRNCYPGPVVGGQGYYDIAIAADPNDANTLYIGGVNTWKSTDGASSFSIVNHWNETCGGTCEVVHADKHCLAFQNGSSVLFEGNDGGIYRTTNGGVNWTDLSNGLVISQYYRLSVSQQSANQIIGGLQDNGTKSMIDGTWADVKGGDGMDCAIHPENYNIQYATNQYSDLYKTTNQWSTETYISGSLGSGNWISPFLIDPNNPSTLYFACSQVFKSTSSGGSWNSISSGITKDAWAMDVAPSNSNYIYVAVEDALYKTTTGDAPWTDITGTLPVSTSFLTAVTVSWEDPEIVWVCMGGYDTDCIYETTDGGTTWTNISSGLAQVPALDIIQNDYNDAETELYAATDVGVYQKVGSADWTPYMTNLPNVVVNDLEIYYDADNPDDSQIFAGTYGRGVWQSGLPAEQICWPPSALTTSNLDCFSVDVSWAAGDASLWNIQYGYSGFELGLGSLIEGVDETTYSLTGLNGGTAYDVYIQGNCADASGTSSWIGPLTFTTEPQGTTCECSQSFGKVPFSQTGLTTENAGNDYNFANGSEPCGTGFMDSEDYVFLYTPSLDTYVDAALSNTEINTGLFVYDGCPDDPSTECVASDYEIGSDNPSVSSVLLRAETTYYIVVSSASTTPYTGFDINITEGSQPVMSFPYSEGFENDGALPDHWFTEQISGTTTWVFQDGGHDGNPTSAQEGSYNALLFDEDAEDDKARLISPLIDLSAALTPELSFYSTQAAWIGQDELKVYYRTTSDGAWNPIPSAEWTSEISSWTEHVLELPSPSATYQIALEGNAKYGHGVCVDNFSVREQPFYSWSGNMNNDWDEMMNWDMGIPGESDNVLIPNWVTNMPEVDDFRQCNNLTIQDGANLSIQTTGSFTVNGNLNLAGTNGITIESDATGTGSLVVEGAISGGGAAEIQRYIPAYSALAGWHFLSSPVASQAICNEFVNNSDPGNPIPGADDFYKWDESTNLWKNTKDVSGIWNDEFEDNFLVGLGYLASYQADQTKSFAGMLNNASLTLNSASTPSVTYTSGQGEGWNLIGNPFPSAIDADELVTTNIDDAIYAFDGSTGQYLSWNGEIGALTDGVIPPMNGFFIKAFDEDPSLTIPLTARLHSSASFLKENINKENVLKLTVEKEGLKDYTFISYSENATVGFDNHYDAYKLFGSESVPHLYTLANDLSLSINTLPFETENVIDLQFSSGQAGTYKLFWESTFDRKYNITLKDRMANNYIDMQKEQEYTFDYLPQEAENLFQVHIKGITGLSEFKRPEELLIYYERPGVVVEIPEKYKVVFIQLFNSLGQRLSQGYLYGSGKHHIPIPSVKGMIIVHAQTTTNNYTNKILIQQ